jgi:hypothetical protein
MKHIAGRIFLPGSLACALLSGCIPFTSPPAPLPAQQLTPVQAFIARHTPGDADAAGTVSDPAFGENLRIVLEQEFFSASGEICRGASLFSQRGEAEVVVMCRNASGHWTMAPRIWGQGLPPDAAGRPRTAEKAKPGKGGAMAPTETDAAGSRGTPAPDAGNNEAKPVTP